MSEETKGTGIEVPATSRRTFVKNAGQVAVTAPAVALLLNASSKSVMAQTISPYAATQQHILDDFTTGNTHEDIDTAAFGNFNPINGTTNQDDHVPS